MAIRYESAGADSPETQEGDVGFFALDSRTEPENLPTGVVQLSENMRLNRRVATTRKGMDKVTNSIDPSGTVPLIVPFTVGSSAIVRDTWADGLFASCVFSDPNDDEKSWIFLAGGSECFAWNETDGVVTLNYPVNETITSTDKCDVIQAEGSVYILRGESSTASAVSYISRSGSTATLVSTAVHGLITGQYITVSGAYPAWYNVTDVTQTVSNTTTLTYTTGTPTNLADTLLEAATTAAHNAVQNVTQTALTYVFSVYAKPNSRDYIQLATSANSASSFFNITAGTVGTSTNCTATITTAGGGWYRCSIAFTGTAASHTHTISISTDGSTLSYLGDVTKGVYLFGAQVEQASAPTDYEPTTSAVGKRNKMLYSEDFSNSAWTKNDTTVSTDSTEEPATGTIVFRQNKLPLRWDGDFEDDFVTVSHGTISAPYIYMPCSDYGLLQENRAVLQYARNKLIVSDILDVESYNSVFGIFTFTSGQADYLIGFHPYQENQVLVFNRRSIYLLNDVDGSVNMMTTQEITRQTGCVSRLSIVTCGSDVLFLSDLGVFRLQPGLELQLRGNSEPLSAPVDDVIQTINTSVIQLSVGAYWNNRYYLAVPVSGSTRNNRILVFNFLNNAWESVDTLPNGMYPDFLEVKQFNNTDTLFVISKEGGIYAYEQLEVDEYAAASQSPTNYVINGRIKSRRLTFGSYNLKHFNRITTNISLNDSSNCTIKVNTINPDGTKTLKEIGVTTAEEITYPLIINRRGYGVDVELVNTAGRTTLTNYSMTAYEQNRKNTKIT